jgi:hypothetical protein
MLDFVAKNELIRRAGGRDEERSEAHCCEKEGVHGVNPCVGELTHGSPGRSNINLRQAVRAQRAGRIDDPERRPAPSKSQPFGRDVGTAEAENAGS